MIFLLSALLTAISSFERGGASKINYLEFDRLTVDIEASVVNSLAQDSSGMMWICTNKGLYSYDGYSIYPYNRAGYESRVQIQCAEFIGDELWMGTDRGVLVYDIRAGAYIPGPYTDMEKEAVRAICRSGDSVYMGYSSGMASYSLSEGVLSWTDVTDGSGHRLGVYAIVESDGILYLGTFNGLYFFDSSGQVKKAGLPDSSLFVYSICKDSARGCLWLGTQKGLWCYRPGEDSIVPVGNIRHQVINEVILDRDGTLVLGTDSGLYLYNGTSMRHIWHESGNDASLSDNDIEALFVDRDGNTWVGTHDGLSVARCWNMTEYIPLRKFTDSDKGMIISSMSILKGGDDLWCGGNNGIVRISRKSGETDIFDIYSPTHPLPHNAIHSLYEDSDGDLWAATDGGLLFFDKGLRSFRQTDLEVDSYNVEWCHDVAVGPDGKVWVGTFSSGILVYDKRKLLSGKGGALERIYKEGINCGHQVKQVIPDSSGYVWVLYYDGCGLARLAPEGSVRTFDIAALTKEQTIPTRMIMDGSGHLWAGYGGGVLCVDTSTLAVSVIPFPEGVSDAEILGMAVSDRYLWMSASTGTVWQVDTESRTVEKLPFPLGRYVSICYDSVGEALLMGSVDGFYMAGLPVRQQASIYRRPEFTSFVVNGAAYGQETGKEINIRFSDSIVLDHDENNLTVTFSSMNFTSAATDQYAYMLEPVSRNWVRLEDGINTISLVDVNPGKYRLSVCKVNEKGEPQENQASTLDITIRPAAMLSPAAFLLYAAILAGIVLWIVKYMKMEARLKSAGFEKDVLMKQATSKIEFLTGISHDLKTPLSLITGPVSRILMAPVDVKIKEQLEIVLKNAEKLNALLGRMLDYKREESGDAVLVRSSVDLSDLVGGILARYMPESASRKIKVSFNCRKQHVFYNCDLHKMESVADNLISNAFKYTPDNGDIHISLYVDEYSDKLYFTVTDNGVGIPESELPYIFQRFFQSSVTRDRIKGTGLGLYLVRKYVEVHGGTIEVSSHEGQGTSFIVEFPFREYAVNLHARKDKETKEPKPYRVLVVEDNEELSSFLADFLSETVDVYTAWNGRDGLTLFRRIRPDLVIADMMMPIMDGMEMCGRIRQEKGGRSVPVIMLTAKSDQMTETESIRAGVDCFMPKPFNAEKLKLKVMSLLESRRRQKESVLADSLSSHKEISQISQNEKFLSEVTGIIEENISLPELNVTFLAEKVHVSTKQLARKLKPLTGLTPVDYIKSIRIKQASLMLAQGRFSVAEVMYSVGFTDPSYFAKCFQQEYGCTPSQYLKSNR